MIQESIGRSYTNLQTYYNKELLKVFIITLDAMGCQKAIVEKIIKKVGDYVISLKGNQGNLHADEKLFL
ncbi:MAG: hypothetical protein COB50_00845 [Thiotrichales bacterium]|nr:MAG: hypothetical protein COB50_00845 [Thiotrichales bacterium]